MALPSLAAACQLLHKYSPVCRAPPASHPLCSLQGSEISLALVCIYFIFFPPYSQLHLLICPPLSHSSPPPLPLSPPFCFLMHPSNYPFLLHSSSFLPMSQPNPGTPLALLHLCSAQMRPAFIQPQNANRSCLQAFHTVFHSPKTTKPCPEESQPFCMSSSGG